LLTHRARLRARITIARGGIAFLVLTAILLACVGISVFGSLDADSTLSRGALTFAQLGGATAVAFLMHDDERARVALRQGATLGVVMFLVLDVLAVMSFVGFLPAQVDIGTATLRLDSYGYAGIIPRLSGTTIDPNNGGLLLLVFAVLAPRARSLAVALLILTLSRSAMLAGAVLAVVAAWEHGIAARTVPLRRVLVGIALCIAGVLAVGRSPQALENAARTLAPFAERVDLSSETGSAGTHGALVLRAADEGSKSVTRAVFGLGWGASFVVLQDFFPGNRYGNFHSLYGTVFAELGVVAFFAMLFMLGGPLGRATQWRPAIAAFIAFNIFYQSTTVPAFWFVLALAWITVQTDIRPVPWRIA
ncbi:MAG: hypothetical protein Q8K55_08440, partial [Gemmatimonadaceae bacterium]|nr:hypothetical protein [Gemmatimonadaceae bacterium]